MGRKKHRNGKTVLSGKKTQQKLGFSVVAAAGLFLLTGCLNNGAVEGEKEVTVEAFGSVSEMASNVVFEDAWLKATDGPMTGVFGVLKNDSGQAIVVESAAASSGSEAELHEVVKGDDGQQQMRKVTDGFMVGPHSRLYLQPGENHIMLLGLTSPISVGDEVTVTLKFKSGQSIDFKTVAKEYSGANENYEPEHTQH